MSDNLKYVMIATEGPHDVEAVSKVLRLRGYTDRDNINDIPEALHFFIPKQYPFNEEGHMERGVPRPSFLMKEEKVGSYCKCRRDQQNCKKTIR